MNPETVLFLNRLNQQFYQTVASSFDETRSTPWSGWLELLPYIQTLASKPLRVLDIGCGNGRFGQFLNQHFPIRYTGVDSNPYLLERAEESLANIPHQLENGDIVAGYSPPPPAQFDLIVLFGVIHHIPGYKNRRQLMLNMREWLAPSGLLVVTYWVFFEHERFRKRIVPWETLPKHQELDLEPHDYLLDWRRGTEADEIPLRYCHYVDPFESQRLTNGFSISSIYDADIANRYVILN